MRVLIESLRRGADANPFKHVYYVCYGSAFATLAVDTQYFAELKTNGKNRVETGHRFLKNHADAITAQRSHCFSVQRSQVGIIE